MSTKTTKGGDADGAATSSFDTRGLRTSLAVLAVALGISACGPGSGNEGQSATHDGKQAVNGSAEGWQAEVAAGARALAGTTTPFQARILRDGKVSFDEYAAATRATVRCMRRSGESIRVGPVRPAPGRELSYEWWVAGRPTTESLEAARGVFERCSRRYETDVKLIYSNQRVIPPERRKAVLDELVACLRGAGVEIEQEHPSMQTLVSALEADRRQRGRACAERYMDVFRVPAPVPVDGEAGRTSQDRQRQP